MGRDIGPVLALQERCSSADVVDEDVAIFEDSAGTIIDDCVSEHQTNIPDRKGDFHGCERGRLSFGGGLWDTNVGLSGSTRSLVSITYRRSRNNIAGRS